MYLLCIVGVFKVLAVSMYAILCTHMTSKNMKDCRQTQQMRRCDE